MKKFFFLPIFFCSALFSDDGYYFDEDCYYEESDCDVCDITPCLPPPPSSISGFYVHVGETKFRSPEGVEGQKLRYDEAAVAFNYTHPLACSCGLILGAAYDRATIDWEDNLEFDQTHFDYVTLLIGSYTTHFPGWLWVATFSIDIDTLKLDLGDYALYNGILYGKYTICKWMTFTAGFIGQVGLDKEKFWPMIGFDFLFAENWRLGLVFPTDLSLTYRALDWVTLGTSVRFLRTRHRLSDDEPIPQGIVEYHVAGLEADLILTPLKWLLLKGFVGSTFNGDVKLTNRTNNDAEHFKFKGSVYVGGQIVAFF